MRAFCIIIVASAVALAFSCGGATGSDAGNDSGGNQGSASANDLLVALVTESCHLQFACCPSADAGLFKTEKQCDDFLGAFVGIASLEIQSDANNGRVSIDGNAARSCIGIINGLDCSAPTDATFSSGVCGSVFTPHQQTGQPCLQGVSCIGGSAAALCKGSETLPDGGTVDGVCAPRGAINAKCSFSSDCTADLSCAHQSDGGESCQPRGDVGASCSQSGDCKDGLACDRSVGACIAGDGGFNCGG